MPRAGTGIDTSADRSSARRLRELLDRHALADQRFRELVARSLGVGASEARTLAHLLSGRPLTATQVCARLNLSSGGATALMHRLEARGLVTRSPHPADARSQLIRPTRRAITLLDERYAPLAAGLDLLAAGLDGRERAVIGGYLGAATALTADAASALRGELAPRAAARGPARTRPRDVAPSRDLPPSRSGAPTVPGQ